MGALTKHQDSDESVIIQQRNGKQDSVLAILEFMNSYVEKLTFTAEKDFVFILGNTGAGKSTLTSLLTGVELESKEIREDSGEFIIMDKSGLISGVSTTNSKTIVPELMVDNDGITYYDCPGFNDSRGVANDISVTYLIQQLIKYARSLKLVFAVSYSSVKVGTGDRRDFMDLAKHAVTFVKNIEKYRPGIALIVTKVENRYVKKNKQPHLVEDSNIIEGVVEFLKQAKLDLESKVNDQISMEEREFNSQKIRFIDILLETNDRNEYERIRIMRLANEGGPVKDIDIMQKERKAIQSMIANNIQYVRKENSDFGYTISDESKNRVHEIMEQMQTCLMDDLEDIGNEIKDYYLQQEQHITDLKVLKETISSGHQRLSGISATNFKIFTKLIVDAANDLDIGVTYENFNQIWRHIECIDFITAISKSNLSSLFDITKGLADTMQYLDDSQKFYQFLIDLHTELSKYEVQKKLPNPKVTELAGRIVGKNMEVNVEALKDFLNQVDLNSLNSIIQHMQMNWFKANALKTVLNHVIQTGAFYSHESENSITVKGYNVKLSDVMKSCSNEIRYFNVFTLNNLFIDVDVNKTGQQLQLTLIAPKWYVIADRKIILSGENGKLHSELKAKDDDGHLAGGANGKPGLPGGPSGHFMAIVNKIVNDDCLEIQLNGGKGGTGQHGGNGKNGIEGETPEKPGWHLFFTSFEDFNFTSDLGVCKIPPFLTVDYEIKGKNAGWPTKGGNGGSGGLGGYQGDAFVVELKRTAQCSITNKKGAIGDPGKGGKGGDGTTNGKIVKAKTLFLVVCSLNIGSTEEDGGTIEKAEDGQDGVNFQCQMTPREPNPFDDHFQIINKYKSYVRDNLVNHIQESELRTFLLDLNEDERVQTKYSPLGFVDELRGIEEQYFKLRNRLSFDPFVRSLRMRIDDYAIKQHKHLSKQDKQLLGYLQAATMSKLCSIQNMSKSVSAVDLLEYLKLIQDHVDDLNKLKKIDVINEHRKKYKDAINTKVSSAKEMIEKQIMPNIEQTLTEINDQITKLIHEIMGKREALQEEQRLKEAMIKQKILFWLKVAGVLILGLSIAGVILSLIMQFHGSITSIYVKNQKVPPSPRPHLNLNESAKNGANHINLGIIPLIKDFMKSSCDMVDLVKQQFRIFNQKLNNIEKSLNKFFESDVTNKIKEKILEFKAKISKELDNENGTPDPTVIGKMQNELKQTINEEKTNLKRNKNHAKDPNVKEKIQKLEDAEDLLTIGNEMENEFYDDAPKVRACAVALTGDSEGQIKQLEILENNLGKILIEKVYEMQQNITAMHLDLASKPHAELDISKWQIQDLLRDVKEYFHKMTSAFEVGRDLQHCIDKLNEGMGTMIGVYDRIDSYAEKQDLADYIANISTSNVDQNALDRTANKIQNIFNRGVDLLVGESQSDEMLRKLKGMIKTNILLEEYETALNAFKQHQFPFAPIYLERVELPADLKINDIDGLRKDAKNKIKIMKTAIQSSKTMIDKYDQDIINVNPLKFYTWKHEEIKDDIIKLLSGKEIILKADIAKGLNQNAVKFKEIGIHLKLTSQVLQHQLDAKLENFGVIMKMVGNSYYRCGKRSYSMSIDENIVIGYSFKKNKNEPTGKNDVYRKILNGGFFLSPYTMWSIQLVGRNFKELDKFKNEVIHLHLTGNGQYVKNSSLITTEIPPNTLDKHYNFDSVIRFPNQNTLINHI